MFTKTTQLLPIQSPDKTSQEGNRIPLCHTMLFSEIFCVQQIYLALLNVASGISPLSRRHHRDGRILTQSFKKKTIKKTANSKTKYCPPATQLWHGVMTLWQYPFRGRQVFVGSGALVPARKKNCRVLVALKTVTMQQICLWTFHTPPQCGAAPSSSSRQAGCADLTVSCFQRTFLVGDHRRHNLERDFSWILALL